MGFVDSTLVFMGVAYLLIRIIQKGHAFLSRRNSNKPRRVGKTPLDQRDQDAAEKLRRERLVELADEFNARRSDAGLRALDPDAFADDTLAQARDARANPSTYRYQSPVVLLPASRQSANIEFDGTSWFGGQPSLGDQAWPRARDGELMHHAAQIDLSELASIDTPKGFPKSGSLAFFVDVMSWPYRGAVVYVPNPRGTPTQPVKTLPRLHRSYDGQGYDIDGYTKDNAPRQFPRWPISFVPLDVIEDPDNYETDPVQEAMEKQFQVVKETYSPLAREHKERFPQLAIPSKWDTAQRFANLMTKSRDEILQKIKERRSWTDDRPKQLAYLAKEESKIEQLTHLKGEGAEDFAKRLAKLRSGFAKKEQLSAKYFDEKVAELAFMAANIENFAALESEVVDWAYANGQWDPMYKTDVTQLENYIAKVDATFGDTTPDLHLFMSSNRRSSDFVDLTLRAMIQAPDAIYNELPPQFRDDFDRKGRFARQGNCHQMFGLARTTQGYENHPKDYLLLKLGRDNAMDWKWDEEDANFWITPDDLEHQRWGNVSVVIGHQ